MPTLRIVYLTEQQYAGMTDHPHGAANNTTAEEQLPSINQEHTTCSRLPIADVTRNAPSNKQSDHEEDNNYLDTLLQEAIDGVNIRSFGGRAVRHQQIQQEMLLSNDEEGENDSLLSERVVDAVQQFQHEMVSSDEESENDSTRTPSAQVDAVQQKSGNERKRPAPIHHVQSFDDRFNNLMAFKAKYGHCDASQTGENASLGRWCSTLRVSYKKIQNNQMPNRKLSDEKIQRLSDAGFKWFSAFDNNFNNLMAFRTKYGHCDVRRTDENATLGRWCSTLRVSYKKIQNNQMPQMKLSDKQIQRLSDAGFKWTLRALSKNGSTEGSAFDNRFKDLMAFKAKYGHCDASQTGENASLGWWCSALRVSYKKIQNNQKLTMKLSNEQIQRLSDADFKWSLSGRNVDERFKDLMAFKTKYGHCNVPPTDENATLGRWCSTLRVSYKKIQNNQKPPIKLSNEQIQRLSDAGFKLNRN
jgi:hypothetical protein